MGFYSDFSDYYEIVFPFRPPVLDFLEQWLSPRGRVLDLGCGTGAYCGRLISSDRPCLGVDLDPAMVGRARQRHPQGEFQALGLESIGALPEGEWAGIFSIGNVLPHLAAGRLPGFLAQLKRMLVPGGIWIFQTVNFDPLTGQEEYVFPVLRFPEQGVEFHRRYTDLNKDHLNFQTRLLHEGQEVFQGEVALCPRTSSRCLAAHRKAGFQLLGHFADFTGKPFLSPEHSGSVYVFSTPETS